MPLEPVAGDVIRYDFLWKEEHQQGRLDGAKDRPCCVVLTTRPDEYGNKTIVVVQSPIPRQKGMRKTHRFRFL